jgi:pyruvate kinase
VAVMDRDPVLEAALSQRLATKRVAEAAGITSQAVSRWRRVPEDKVTIVARVTGISARRLRPDLYVNGRRIRAAQAAE